jgi:hypothetical protein
MANSSYEVGTVSVANGDTVIVGSGTIWSGVAVRPGDEIYVDNAAQAVKIKDVVDPTHVTLWTPWAGGNKVNVAFIIVQDYPARVVGSAAAVDVGDLLAVLSAQGLLWYLSADYTDPTTAKITADDGQGILQVSTGKLWTMDGGAWVFAGVFKGLGELLPWNSATAYQPFMLAADAGNTYFCNVANTNQRPPNAAKGDQGIQGIQGKGYSTTSVTSQPITTGSKTFAVDAGLAALPGTRYRASNGSNYMEGVVTAYSGTSLTINMAKVSGSGTFAAWNLNLAGDPGSGDMSSTNYASEYAGHESTVRSNLGATTVGDALFTAANASAARGNLSAAKSGANSDITSLASLTTALSVAQGGTGYAGGTLTAFTPVVGSGGGAIGSYTASGAYLLVGKALFVRFRVDIASIGSATSWLTVSMPFTLADDAHLAGASPNIGQVLLIEGLAGSASFICNNFNNTAIGVTSGQRFSASGFVNIV